tara:strand:- start:216 stop:398 length:183 start_codon:yes stop_codon:yes gene_type:complete
MKLATTPNLQCEGVYFNALNLVAKVEDLVNGLLVKHKCLLFNTRKLVEAIETNAVNNKTN